MGWLVGRHGNVHGIGCALALALAPACAADEGDGDEQGSLDGDTDAGSTGGDGGEVSGAASTMSSSDSDGVGTTDPSGTATGGDDGPDSGGDPGSDGGSAEGGGAEPGQLTAGEWRDLDHWDFWLALFEQGSMWESMDDTWGFVATAGRVPVDVTQDGQPLGDVAVELRDATQTVVWSARTDVHGRAELFAGWTGEPATAPFSVAVGPAAAPVVVEAVTPDANTPIAVQTTDIAAPPAVLDLMFVVDTTGSMADELSYLQVELADVIEQVRDASGDQLAIRLSVNFYRDHGDEYVVRSFPFTTDITQALGQLAAQAADGGGDFPEALDEAVADAIHGHQWSPDARARLLFVVFDAPPHDDVTVKDSVRSLVVDAAEQGIRVIPVAGSGIDKPTEFLARLMDIGTGGTYTFLTSDSGIGGEHLEPTVGDYQVELLNELLVRLVSQAVGGV